MIARHIEVAGQRVAPEPLPQGTWKAAVLLYDPDESVSTPSLTMSARGCTLAIRPIGLIE